MTVVQDHHGRCGGRCTGTPGADGAAGEYRVRVGFLDRRRHWFAWWDGKFRSLLFDLLVVYTAIQPAASTGREPSVLGIIAMVLSAPAFLLRRRFPWLAVAAAVVMSLTEAGGGAVACMIAAYTMARRRGPGKHSWVAAGAVLAAGEYATAGYLFQEHKESWDLLDTFAPVVVMALGVGVSVLLGLWLYQRKRLVETLRERAEQAERERDLLAERAVATERRRIAREMHDVIAHRCSVISLQAGALTVSAPDERTGEVAEVIRKTSSTALTELRSMLRVLRDDEHDAERSGETAADPTVESIGKLVAEGVESGANIHLDMPDQLPETSSEIGRAAYRVVQEALTNAAKHAPHATVHVEVAAVDEELVVSVSNRRAPGVNTGVVPGSGYGLIGMRERVTLAGGAMRAGWTDDGGYRVRAVFPLGDRVAV